MPADHAPSQGLMKWNEMDEMSMEKWWNEIGGRGKWEKPREKPTQTPCRPTRNPHGVTETRTREPAVGGERLTACATRPPNWNDIPGYTPRMALSSTAG